MRRIAYQNGNKPNNIVNYNKESIKTTHKNNEGRKRKQRHEGK